MARFVSVQSLMHSWQLNHLADSTDVSAIRPFGGTTQTWDREKVARSRYVLFMMALGNYVMSPLHLKSSNRYQKIRDFEVRKVSVYYKIYKKDAIDLLEINKIISRYV